MPPEHAGVAPAPPIRSVAVVGAGLAGLVAARELVAAGVEVVVLDKGRSVGGRLATRRIGDARLDHGAQFFTVRTPAFQRRVDDWIERGLVREWSRGFSHGSIAPGHADEPIGDGHPRYVATAGMNSLAKDLAAQVTDLGGSVETDTMVFAVRHAPVDAPHRWSVAIDDGSSRDVDAVVVTAPLPQTFSLLVDMVWTAEDDDAPAGAPGEADGESAVPAHAVELPEGLFRTEYDRTIGLLCTVDGPTAIPPPGAVHDPDGPLSFVADNAAKGISDEPAITVHAGAGWSEEHWDDDLDLLRDRLIELSRLWLGEASIVEAQVKKWRFATPRTLWPDPCFVTGGGALVLAGDAFAGPRVEGAHNSGLAAAHALLA